jgi:hypothetical protein
MSVSTSELNNTSIVYPNPTYGLIHIVTDMTLPYTVEVYDVSERLLNQVQSDHSDLSFELPEIAGLYFLKVKNGKEQIIKKVYKY